MSRENLWQICHRKEFDNGHLTSSIVDMLRAHGITTKQAALDLGISVGRARNWFYRNTGMSALDLLRLMQTYHFIHVELDRPLLWMPELVAGARVSLPASGMLQALQPMRLCIDTI